MWSNRSDDSEDGRSEAQRVTEKETLIFKSIRSRLGYGRRWTYWFFKLKDARWAGALARAFVPFSAELTCSGGALRSGLLNLTIGKDLAWLLLGYADLEKLVKTAGAVCTRTAEGGLDISVGGIKIALHDTEEIFILSEVFLANSYPSLDSQPVLLWDVGLNVGISTLFFGANPNIEVEGFDPFPETFAAAQANIQKNPQIAPRIHIHNCGIARGDRKEEGYFVPGRKGSSGLFSTSEIGTEEKSERRRVDIVLRSASEVLDELVRQYPGRKILAKIDCEGAEYEIVDALDRGGKLSRLSACMMEWHRFTPDQDPRTLVAAFRRNGFMVLLLGNADGPNGMLHAFRLGS